MPSETPSEKRTILVIEDDKDLLRGLTLRLKANGYRVTCAEDAVQGMSTARRSHPDLVLLDLGLPGGSGFDLIERMHTRLPYDVPVIVLTAADPSVAEPKALALGAVAFFQKPADNEDLLSCIRWALGEEAVGPKAVAS